MQRWVEAFVDFGSRLVADEEIDNAIRELEEVICKEKVREFRTMMDVLIHSLDDQAPFYLALLEDIIQHARPLEILEIVTNPITNQITQVIIVKQITTESSYLGLWFHADYMW